MAIKAQQLDLFDKPKKPRKMTPHDVEKTTWYAGLCKTVETMPRGFWFSELRQKHSIEPKCPAWWGMARSALTKHKYRPTDRVRQAPIGYGSRKGGQDRLWEKIS